jgi:hypothetical protein
VTNIRLIRALNTCNVDKRAAAKQIRTIVDLIGAKAAAS